MFTEARRLPYTLSAGAVFLLALAGCGSGGGNSASSIACPNGSRVDVAAKPSDFRADILTSSGIPVRDGDLVSIDASGQWDVGLGAVSADGAGSCSGCPVPAPLGALIGRIGSDGPPFLVGSKATFAAVGSGALFLGSNDNALGRCDGTNVGSCYGDNRGTLQLCVTVEPGPAMTSTLDAVSGTLRVFRRGELTMVYQRDPQPGRRSIGNAITELYAVGRSGDNLLRDDSPLVPPQILVGVQDALIPDVCFNNLADNSCDYFVHHGVTLSLLQASGSAVIFRVQATATQHDDKGTPLEYSSDITVTVPFHTAHTLIEYDVRTSLNQPVNVRFALRPLPFFELVNNPYNNVSYLGANCSDVITVSIPTQGPDFFTFLPPSPVCPVRPWAAIHHNDRGNLGMILQSTDWSSGIPELVSFTETRNHPGAPNLYFQSSDNSRVYQSGDWSAHVIFLAYTNATDHTPVQRFRDAGPP